MSTIPFRATITLAMRALQQAPFLLAPQCNTPNEKSRLQRCAVAGDVDARTLARFLASDRVVDFSEITDRAVRFDATAYRLFALTHAGTAT